MMTALILALGMQATPAAALRAALEQAAGGPVALDPRLQVPHCPAGWQISRTATALAARCPGQGWQFLVPAAAAPASVEGPLVKRGSAVVVEAAAHGIVARIEAIAEQDGAVGDQVRVRNALSGRRLVARVDRDGRLIANSR